MSASGKEIGNKACTDPIREPESANPQVRKVSLALAKAVSLQLSTALNTAIACQPLGPQQNESLLRQQNGPVLRMPLMLQPGGDAGVLEIAENFANRLVQVLLGTPAGKDLGHACLWTDLEVLLLTNFFRELMDRSRSAWVEEGGVEFVSSGRFEICGASSDRDAQEAELNCVCLSAQWGEYAYPLVLLLPRLFDNRQVADPNGRNKPLNSHGQKRMELALRAIGKTPVMLEAVIHGASLSGDELANLGEGATITFDDVHVPAISVTAGGLCLFEAGVEGSLRGRRLVRVRQTKRL